jgi:signal transduction histidine kinase
MNLSELEQAARQGAAVSALTPGLGAVLAEIASHLTGDDTPPEELSLASAREYGRSRAEVGASAVEVGREVLETIARTQEQLGPAEVEPWALQRLRALGDQAVLLALGGWEQQRKDRREHWLSFLVHDLKNPLNTVLNAVWLIRGKTAGREDVEKLLRMVERAAHRMEERLAEVRELEYRSVASAPPGRALPSRPAGRE